MTVWARRTDLLNDPNSKTPFYTSGHRNQNLSMVAMCVERIVATIRSNRYETNGVALGLLLLAFTNKLPSTPQQPKENWVFRNALVTSSKILWGKHKLHSITFLAQTFAL
ncbi:hypothetical protein KIN20_001841 [Parelaphostrongylus tenuis]|uniref:Uncharacterized protein n=1 Tax=Parelaphostrongylus tenuis TaxID=148309 RepID=A0AAD5QGE4_PARTN|nr:hypothetical protein KIN20_001841 [Parelaphostrongylus tenuis]